MNDGDDGEAEDRDDGESDDDSMGGVTFEEFYRDQRHAAVHAQPDSFLQALVGMVERGTTNFNVTLFVHGAVVTGDAVSFAQWLDTVRQRLDTETVGGQVFDEVFRTLALGHQVDTAPEPDYSQPPGPAPLAIHLVNATLWTGGVGQANDLLLRYRLSEIAGWALGRATAT
jgi:hypothetical protein